MSDMNPRYLTVLADKGTEEERRTIADAVMAGKPVMYRVGIHGARLYLPVDEPINAYAVAVVESEFKMVGADGHQAWPAEGLKIGENNS